MIHEFNVRGRRYAPREEILEEAFKFDGALLDYLDGKNTKDYDYLHFLDHIYSYYSENSHIYSKLVLEYFEKISGQQFTLEILGMKTLISWVNERPREAVKRTEKWVTLD